jgi:hypothetical protein
MRPRFRNAAAPVLFLLLFSLLTAGVVAYAENKEVKKTPAAATPSPNDMAPENLTIDSIKKLYGPVEFTHKAHLGYAGDCATCHHHSQPGEYFPCEQCHPKNQITTAKNRLIGLKGAYHRQCMNCHRTMGSGPSGCTDCHEKVKQPAPAKAGDQGAQPKAAQTSKAREQ